MKRLIAIILAFSLLPIIALAELPDISGLSFDELKEMQAKVNEALWLSDGWKEVVVPVGLYKVGTDIPAGRWTVKRSVDDYTYFRIGTNFVNGDLEYYLFTSDLEYEANIILEEGTYVEISYCPVVFTTYVPSFSFD